MPQLVRFMIIHLSYGGLLGMATATVMILIRPETFGVRDGINPIALVLQLYAFVAPFTPGSLATALALLQEP